MDTPPFHQLCMVEPVFDRFHQFSKLHLDLQSLILLASKTIVRIARAINSYWRSKALEQKLEYDTLDYPSVKEVEMYLNTLPKKISFLFGSAHNEEQVRIEGHSRTYNWMGGEYVESSSLKYVVSEGGGEISIAPPLSSYPEFSSTSTLNLSKLGRECPNSLVVYDVLTMKWIVEYRLKLFDTSSDELIKKYALQYFNNIVGSDYLKATNVRFLFLFQNAQLQLQNTKIIETYEYLCTTGGIIRYDNDDETCITLNKLCDSLYSELVAKLQE